MRGFELEAHWGIKNSFTNRETAPGNPLARRRGEEPLDVQLLGAALRLPQIVGKLHLQPVLPLVVLFFTHSASISTGSRPRTCKNKRQARGRDPSRLAGRGRAPVLRREAEGRLPMRCDTWR